MIITYRNVKPYILHSSDAVSNTLLRLSGVSSAVSRKSPAPSTPAWGRRSFSWRIERLSSSHHPPSIYKSSLSYNAPTPSSYSKVSYRGYFWKRGHFLNQYTQSPEWRLLSSCGKPSVGASNSGKRSRNDEANREGQEDDWYNAWQKRNRATLRQFDELKRMIDEDPYKALFGRPWQEGWCRSDKDSHRKKAAEDKSKSTTAQTDVSQAQTKQANSSTSPLPTSGEDSLPATTSHFAPVSSDDFVFDPITMRRIPKETLAETPSSTGSNESSASISIPVKTFRSSSKAVMNVGEQNKGKPAAERAAEEDQHWLMREGFGKTLEEKKPIQHRQQSSSSRIESALDRYQKKPRPAAGEGSKNTVTLRYDPKETQTDDVDLLTASDIRASSGRLGRSTPETTKEKKERRDLLEKKYDEHPLELEKRLESELAAQKAQADQTVHKGVEEIAEAHRKWGAATKAHEQEVKTQKAAMEAHETHHVFKSRAPSGLQAEHSEQGEGDMASNVHEFGSRDRWYKRKAPHANADTEQKLLQATKDKNFVREIRGIYEDTYGTIDTKHHQQPMQALKEDSEYPSDAYPGTLYEQPWTANVLNDHPDIDAKSKSPAFGQAQLQEHYEKQNMEALTLIGKLFCEMRENQILLQEHREQLQGLAIKDTSQNLFQSFKACEQRIMQTLKAAQNLFKSKRPVAASKNDTSDAVAPSSESGEPMPSLTQPEKHALEKETPTPPTLYKIVAYDPSTQRVTTSKTTNLVGPVTGKPLTFSEALFGLENPAKFLSHMTALQHGEYEIAAGGPNLLVFRKVRQLKPSPEEKAPEDPLWNANPIDGMVAPTGNFASPTGFVNYDPPLPEPEPPKAAPNAVRGKDKVRRQEAVFSGSSRRPWHDQSERGSTSRTKMKGKHRKVAKRRQTVKRMFLVGVLTAAGCYAVGVASEFFRV